MPRLNELQTNEQETRYSRRPALDRVGEEVLVADLRARRSSTVIVDEKLRRLVTRVNELKATH